MGANCCRCNDLGDAPQMRCRLLFPASLLPFVVAVVVAVVVVVVVVPKPKPLELLVMDEAVVVAVVVVAVPMTSVYHD